MAAFLFRSFIAAQRYALSLRGRRGVEARTTAKLAHAGHECPVGYILAPRVARASTDMRKLGYTHEVEVWCKRRVKGRKR